MRRPELASLRAALLDAPEQSPAGIHGVGGMGKTALAQAFAYKEADAFPGGCWLLRCEGRDRLLSVFRNLVNDLEIELADEERLDDAKAVRRVFDVLRARGPVLFLLDNVDRPALLAQEQMKLLADQPWARVLYTTRLALMNFATNDKINGNRFTSSFSSNSQCKDCSQAVHYECQRLHAYN